MSNVAFQSASLASFKVKSVNAPYGMNFSISKARGKIKKENFTIPILSDFHDYME